MKNYQVRLADGVHATLREIAEARDVSIADLVRESLEVYAVAYFYAQEGKQLFWEDPDGKRAEVLIPGLTVDGARRRHAIAAGVSER